MRAELLGQSIDGRYEIEALLGEGGMGTVVRARHRFTQESFALKILHPALAGDAATSQRFLNEAQAPAAIGHPAIVRVIDAGRTPDGDLFLAMELLAGETLGLRIRSRGPLSIDAAERVGVQILSALSAAHDAGFVHRDLKPENVFLVAPGDTVKLLDFGIAKVLHASGPSTASGAVLGTPTYMSPEQLRDSGQVDHRADLWAFGVLLFEMLTGALPYDATTFQDLYARIVASPEAPFDLVRGRLSPPLEALLRRALSPAMANRFTSAEELSAALRDACARTRSADEPQVASTERAPNVEPPSRTRRSPDTGAATSGLRRLAAWLRGRRAVALVVAGLVVAAPVAWFSISQPRAVPIGKRAEKILFDATKKRGLPVSATTCADAHANGKGDKFRCSIFFDDGQKSFAEFRQTDAERNFEFTTDPLMMMRDFQAEVLEHVRGQGIKIRKVTCPGSVVLLKTTKTIVCATDAGRGSLRVTFKDEDHFTVDLL